MRGMTRASANVLTTPKGEGGADVERNHAHITLQRQEGT